MDGGDRERQSGALRSGLVTPSRPDKEPGSLQVVLVGAGAAAAKEAGGPARTPSKSKAGRRRGVPRRGSPQTLLKGPSSS